MEMNFEVEVKKKGFFNSIYTIVPDVRFTAEEVEQVREHLRKMPTHIDLLIYTNDLDFAKFYSTSSSLELTDITLHHLIQGITCDLKSSFEDMPTINKLKELISDMYEKAFRIISKYSG